MTVRDPTAKVVVQEREGLQNQAPGTESSPRTAPAFSFTWEQTKFTATIEGANSTEGVASTLNLEIPNLPSEIASRINVNGFVRVDAGYASTDRKDPGAVSPAPVFYGGIQDVGFHRQGAEKRYTITAHTNPAHVTQTFVPLDVASETPIADIIDQLLRAVGGNLVSASRAARGNHPGVPPSRATVPSYATKPNRSTYDEIVSLVKSLSHQTGHRHRVVPAMDEKTVASYELRDLDDANPEREAIEITYPADTVHTLDLTPSDNNDKQRNTITPANQQEELREIERQTAEFQLRASVAFDSRLRQGALVVAEDEGAGFRAQLVIDTVQHDIGGWTSNFTGEIQELTT